MEEIDVRVIGFANGAYVLRAQINGGRVDIHHRPRDRREASLLELGLREERPMVLEIGGMPAARVRDK